VRDDQQQEHKEKEEAASNTAATVQFTMTEEQMSHIQSIASRAAQEATMLAMRSLKNFSVLRNDLIWVHTARVLIKDGEKWWWIVDSGCTRHMGCNKDDFIDMQRCATVTILVADGRMIKANYKGTVLLYTDTGVVRLEDTLYVPSFTKSLVSIRMIDKQGGSSVFGRAQCTARDRNANPLFVAPLVDGLYRLRTLPEAEESNVSLQLLHRRAGHLNKPTLIRAVRAGAVKGVTLERHTCIHRDDCVICGISKGREQPLPKQTGAVRKPFDKGGTATQNAKPGEIWSSDVLGPFTESVNGDRYIVHFTCAGSGLDVTCCSGDKTGATLFLLWQMLRKWSETQTGRKVKRFV
jgi:hypothetical protein